MLCLCCPCFPSQCSLNEVCQELDGRLLYGSAEDLDCGEGM